MRNLLPVLLMSALLVPVGCGSDDEEQTSSSSSSSSKKKNKKKGLEGPSVDQQIDAAVTISGGEFYSNPDKYLDKAVAFDVWWVKYSPGSGTVCVHPAETQADIFLRIHPLGNRLRGEFLSGFKHYSNMTVFVRGVPARKDWKDRGQLLAILLPNSETVTRIHPTPEELEAEEKVTSRERKAFTAAFEAALQAKDVQAADRSIQAHKAKVRERGAGFFSDDEWRALIRRRNELAGGEARKRFLAALEAGQLKEAERMYRGWGFGGPIGTKEKQALWAKLLEKKYGAQRDAHLAKLRAAIAADDPKQAEQLLFRIPREWPVSKEDREKLKGEVTVAWQIHHTRRVEAALQAEDPFVARQELGKIAWRAQFPKAEKARLQQAIDAMRAKLAERSRAKPMLHQLQVGLTLDFSALAGDVWISKVTARKLDKAGVKRELKRGFHSAYKPDSFFLVVVEYQFVNPKRRGFSWRVPATYMKEGFDRRRKTLQMLFVEDKLPADRKVVIDIKGRY